MPFSFPPTPAVNDTYSYSGRTWIWTGVVWQSVGTAQGLTGAQGQQGDPGAQGAQGLLGFQGIDGLAGAAGLQGIQGFQGPNAAISFGATPPPSPLIGDRWVDSNSGIEFTFVDDGTNQVWVEVSASGFAGTQGVSGAQGSQGIQGSDANMQGTQGIQGLQGSGVQGLQGIAGSAQGLQGPQGSNALITFDVVPPVSPSVGDRWIDSNSGIEYTYVDDGTNQTWVETSASGFSGVQGLQGPQGIQGSDATMQGAQGTIGAQGTDGTSGTQGLTGLQGTQGFQGLNAGISFGATPPVSPSLGDRWVDSNTGIEYTFIDDGTNQTWVEVSASGFSGVQGLQGPTGAGLQGAQGIQGAGTYTISPTPPLSPSVGDTWLNEDDGTVSVWNGLEWFESNTNLSGLQGIQGLQGLFGWQGTQGSNGPQGIQGVQGLQGNQGLQGLGIQGLQGNAGTAQGTQGLQGDQGVQGVQGLSIQGTAGLFAGQGANGTQGTDGAQGTQGSQGFGLQGPQGLLGTQGISGLSGLNQTNFYDVVRDYAVVAGEADSSSKIQLALDAARDAGGGTVYIPSGLYNLQNRLEIYTGTTLLLSQKAIMFREHNTNMIINGDGGGSYTGYDGQANIKIIGGIWENRATAFPTTPAMCISIGHGQNIIIQDLTVTNVGGYHAIEVNSSKNVRITNCRFLGYLDTGGRGYSEAIQIDLAKSSAVFGAFGTYDDTPCEDVIIDNCYFGASGTAGTTAWPTGIGTHSYTAGYYHTNVKMVNNQFDGLTEYAIRTYVMYKNLVIANNTINSCYGGIAIGLDGNADDTTTTQPAPQQSQNITISNNIILNTNGTNAIALWNVDGAVVTNNQIQNVTRTGSNLGDGILFVTVVDGVIANNRIEDTSQDCIDVRTNSSAIMVANNITKDPSQVTTNTHNHIYFSDSVTSSSIIANRGFKQGSNIALSGILITGTCSGMRAFGNHYGSAATTAFSDASSAVTTTTNA